MTELFNDDDFDIPDTAAADDFDLDSLRASSARAGSLYDEDMEDVDDMNLIADTGSASAFSLANFSPGQRLVLALLLLFDFIAIAVGILVVTGRL